MKEHCDGYLDDKATTTSNNNNNAATTNTMKERNRQHRDIFFVNNGDFVDGTGLSQTEDPGYLIPLLEKMPYDAVNCGNHELYSNRNIEYMKRPGGYVDWWGDRYLTSNINRVGQGDNYNGNSIPLGNHYKLLEGKNSNLLVFGFLYNMKDYGREAGIIIEDVEKVVAHDWFLRALSEEHYDAILVLSHMDLVDPLVEVIRSSIRNRIGDGTPVVFITGHTHYRGVKQLDDLTMTYEAGRYLDTVGFVSFPKKESVRSANASSLFAHKFLDANRNVLFQDTLRLPRAEDGATENGKDLSLFIEQTREKLGLKKEIGCAPKSYYFERHVDAQDSLWGLYRDQVIPKIFFSSRQTMVAIEEEAMNDDDDLPMAMLLSKDAWRYDLYNTATLTVDDIMAVAPFNDTIVHLGEFSRKVIIKANQTLNRPSDGDNMAWLPELPNYIFVGSLDGFDNNTKYHLYSHDHGSETVQKVLRRLAPKEKVVIKPTDFRSTMIWMAFVDEYWTCDGTIGQLPEWFPTPQSVVQNLNSHEKDYKTLLAFLVIAMIMLGLIITALAMLVIVFRNYVFYQPITTGDDEEDTVEFYNVDITTSMGGKDHETF